MKTFERVDKSEVHLERAIGDLTVHGDIDETNAQLLLWVYISNIEVVLPYMYFCCIDHSN